LGCCARTLRICCSRSPVQLRCRPEQWPFDPRHMHLLCPGRIMSTQVRMAQDVGFGFLQLVYDLQLRIFELLDYADRCTAMGYLVTLTSAADLCRQCVQHWRCMCSSASGDPAVALSSCLSRRPRRDAWSQGAPGERQSGAARVGHRPRRRSVAGGRSTSGASPQHGALGRRCVVAAARRSRPPPQRNHRSGTGSVVPASMLHCVSRSYDHSFTP